MNLLHFKYALEVAREESFSKAAEKLYTGQPNLSRAIKGLEGDIGIKIFKRTSRGIIPTPEGREFLSRAEKIMNDLYEIEKRFNTEHSGCRRFSMCAPRTEYIATAFRSFTKNMDLLRPMEISYSETDFLSGINKVVSGECGFGIIRYKADFDKYCKELFEEKKLKFELVYEFSPVILMSMDSSLADKATVSEEELKNLIEIMGGEAAASALNQKSEKQESSEAVRKRIVMSERAGRLEFLSECANAFMQSAPISEETLQRYGLVAKSSDTESILCRDVLISKRDYTFSTLDNLFINELMKEKRKLG